MMICNSTKVLLVFVVAGIVTCSEQLASSLTDVDSVWGYFLSEGPLHGNRVFPQNLENKSGFNSGVDDMYRIFGPDQTFPNLAKIMKRDALVHTLPRVFLGGAGFVWSLFAKKKLDANMRQNIRVNKSPERIYKKSKWLDLLQLVSLFFLLGGTGYTGYHTLQQHKIKSIIDRAHAEDKFHTNDLIKFGWDRMNTWNHFLGAASRVLSYGWFGIVGLHVFLWKIERKRIRHEKMLMKNYSFLPEPSGLATKLNEKGLDAALEKDLVKYRNVLSLQKKVRLAIIALQAVSGLGAGIWARWRGTVKAQENSTLSSEQHALNSNMALVNGRINGFGNDRSEFKDYYINDFTSWYAPLLAPTPDAVKCNHMCY